MEKFEFELLKAELLTQPMEKDGNQLFHRKASQNSSWLKSVSRSRLAECEKFARSADLPTNEFTHKRPQNFRLF